jgi:hypothetical protein
MKYGARSSGAPFERSHATAASLAIAALTTPLLMTNPVEAEDVIIKRPGDHADYSVEVEPHLDLAFFMPAAGSSGFGGGARLTIPVMHNGFVPKINDSVGIGFGIDWIHYNGCYYYAYYYNYAYCNNLDSFWIPIVLQWNFFLSTHWSVFGEPGLGISFANYGAYYGCYDARGVPIACGNGPNRLGIDPIIFLGGRYHFSDQLALTLRLGWPYASLGLSFML